MVSQERATRRSVFELHAPGGNRPQQGSMDSVVLPVSDRDTKCIGTNLFRGAVWLWPKSVAHVSCLLRRSASLRTEQKLKKSLDEQALN
jgi:hypothetical protein